MRSITLFAAACAACSIVPGARAQSGVPVGPEVIVTATRVAESLSDAHAHATVINAADLAEGGYTSLAEVLQARGGVEMTASGGAGQPSAVFLRGAEARHTLVLIDGMRVGSATAGGTALEHIPMSQIERIEIVPGPMSGVYGSDAIGGVIQVFTRGTAPAASAKISAGSFDTREFSGGLARRVNDTAFGLHAGTLETRGFDATRPTIPFAQHNPDRDGYRNNHVTARLTQYLGADHELGLNLSHSVGATHFDAGMATDDVNRQTLQTFSAYSRNRLLSYWDSLLRIGISRDHSVSTGAFPGYFRTDQHQALWQNQVRTTMGNFTGGLEYLSQRVASDTPYSGTRRDVKSVFAGYRGDFAAHSVQLNAREDRNSQFGTRRTGSVGYSYRFTPSFRLRAAHGTAFKAPTFNDLYFPDFAPFFFSNPNLRPERSRSSEMGLNYDNGRHHAALTLFRNRISDLITVVTDPATFVSTTQNINAAAIDGVQASYRGAVAGWRVRIAVTLQDPRDQASGAQLRRRARQFGSVGLERRVGAWTLGGEVVAAGARFDSTGAAPNTRLHGYALTHLIARYALAKDWKLTLRWANVFDRQYETVQFYNTPRSSFLLSLAYGPH